MKKKKNMMEKIVQLLQKLTRYSKEQKWFLGYLGLLSVLLLFFPIVSVSSISEEVAGYSVRLLGGTFFKTAFFIFVILVILIGWNISYRYKNLMIRYLGFRNDDNLINFLLLWIIAIAFIGITESISLTHVLSTEINITGFGKFIQLVLMIGLVLSLWLVIKDAKDNGKKAKIITMQDKQDHHHELNTKEKEQLRGLFDK